MRKILLFMMLFIGYLLHYEKTISQEMVLNFIDKPETMDPQLATSTSATRLNELLSEGLTRFDENSNSVPGIAEKWDISEDGLTWTFYLREAKWEDGSPITADNFKFAWLRALDPEVNADYNYMLFDIKGAKKYNSGKGSRESVGIKVVDSKTLEVKFDRPVRYFHTLTNFPIFNPLSEKYYNEHKDKYGTDSFLSSGAYKLAKLEQSTSLYLVKNENYWNKDNIRISEIKIRFLYNDSKSLEAFENGELDVTKITVEQYQEYKDDKRLVSYNDGSVWYLEYNLKNKFLKNKKIRQALTLALDKEELAEILEEMGEPAYGFVPEFIQGIDKSFRTEAGDTFPQYNPDKARKLFAEGLKELGLDKAPKVSIIFNDAGNNEEVIQYIQEKIKKELGLELDVQLLSFMGRLAKMTQKDFDIVLAGWSADYNDALSYMDLWLTNGGNNHTSYSNPKYDALVKIAQTSPSSKERVNIMIKAEKILGDDMPIGILYFRKQVAIVNPRIKNMKFKEIGSEFYLYDASIE